MYTKNEVSLFQIKVFISHKLTIKLPWITAHMNTKMYQLKTSLKKDFCEKNRNGIASSLNYNTNQLKIFKKKDFYQEIETGSHYYR